MPLPCEILPARRVQERTGSGHVSFGKNGVEGTRKWEIPWIDPVTGQDWISFVQQLLGLTISGPNATPVVTQPDTFSQALPWLYCQDVSVEGETMAGADAWGRIAYQRAILTAKYTPYEMGEHFHLAAQMLSFKENQFSWIGPYQPPPPPPLKPNYGDNLTVLLDDLATAITATNAQLTTLQNTLQSLQAQIDATLGTYGAFCGDLTDENAWGNAIDAVISATLNTNQNSGTIIQTLNQQRGQYLNAQNNYNDLSVYLDELSTTQSNLQTQQASQSTTDADYAAQIATWLQQVQQSLFAPGITDAQYKALVTPATPVNAPVGKIIPLGEYTVEKHQVLLPDFSTWISLLGCVNATYFLGFPIWTLLFHGIDGKRVVMPNGSRCWDITLKFLFNPNGHNMLYHPVNGDWEVIVSSGLSPANSLWWAAGNMGNAQPNLLGQNAAAPTVLLHKYVYPPADFSIFLGYH